MSRVEIDEKQLEKINGGAIKLTEYEDGSFKLTGDYTGQSITLPANKFFKAMQICGDEPDTEEGEKNIFAKLAKL